MQHWEQPGHMWGTGGLAAGGTWAVMHTASDAEVGDTLAPALHKPAGVSLLYAKVSLPIIHMAADKNWTPVGLTPEAPIVSQTT